MREYAIKIDVDGTVFRYATDRLAVTETIGGEDVDLLYLPMLIDITAPASSISIEGLPQIPNYSVKVADYYLDLRSSLEQGEYERVKCTVYVFEDGVIVGAPSEGYMSQPSFDEATISFTVRMEEDAAEGDYLDVFSFNTFQYTNIVTPTSVTLVPDFQYHETTPWTVEAYSIAGGTLSNSLEPGDDEIIIRIDPEDPVLLAGGSAQSVFVPFDDLLSLGTLDTDRWENTTEARLEFELSTGRIYDLDNQVNSFGTAWDGGGSGYFAYVQILGSANNDGVYNIVSNGTDPTKGQWFSVGGTLNGLTADEIVNGGVRIYPGQLKTRFLPTGGTGTLILGETAMLTYQTVGVDRQRLTGTKVELVKYIGPVTTETSGGKHWVRIKGVGQGAASTHPIRWAHQVTAGVQSGQYSHQDRIIVSLNGYRPLRDDNQPATVGFINVKDDTKVWPTTDGGWVGLDGDTGRLRELPDAKRFRVNHRYSYNTYSDGGINGGVAVFKIHNSRLNTTNVLAAPKVWSSHGHKLVRKDMGTPVRLCDFFWQVSEMSVPIINAIEPETGGENLQLGTLDLTNRLRGRRVDMLQSTSDSLQIYRSATNTENPSDLSQQNLALVNLGRRFAVVKESSGSGSTKSETLKFDSSDGAMKFVEVGYSEDGDVEDLGFVGEPGDNAEDLPYTNLFRYNVDFGSRSQQTADTALGYDEAMDFFLCQKYRLVFDEVPQNGDSVGKFFPVVYGSVRKVPLLQVISHKVLKEDQASAGDDLYIYASHPCLSKNAADFDIELSEKEEGRADAEVVRIQGLPTALNRNKAESPFPKRGYNHYANVQNSSGVYELTGGNILYSPYHRVEIKESLDGKRYYGIRLRGGEYDPSVGALDKRYPIRHGVGTTQLVASFAGKVDSRGRFIQHPVDVIRDFVKTYGKYPYTENMFDEENLAYVKSLTSKLKVAVYLDEQIAISEFIDKVCRQSGLTWYPDGGQIRLAVLNLDDPVMLQASKPIAEHLNLVQAVSGRDAGKQVAYTRIIYRYQKNYATNSFDGVIDLNARNNQYCAAASKALGSKKEFTIDADWINDPGVAYFAALRHASVLARSRIEYDVEVIRGSQLFKPGDLVPVTYSPLGLNNVPMLVQSLQEDDFTDKIKLVRFV